MNYTEKYNLKGAPKVEQFYNPETGKPVKNHFVLTFDNGEVFQSYNSIVAVDTFNDWVEPPMNRVYLGKDYNASTTTSKYLNMWLGMTSKQVTKEIKDGFITLDPELI